MLKNALGIVALLVLTAGTAAAGYNYVSPETVKGWIETKRTVIVVDIQPPEAFARSHLPGALETGAFPAKSDDDRNRLLKVLGPIAGSSEQIVIVCPRGGSGAKNSYDFLKGKGVEEKRLLILEKGMEGWPYPEMTAKGR